MTTEYESLAELKELIEGLRDANGFVPHKNVHYQAGSEDPVETRRRSEDFEYSCGLTLDVDLPLENAFGLRSVHDVIDALGRALPSFRDTQYLWSYSSSANIYTKDGTLASTKLGLHIRFMTEHQWTQADLKNLVKRLILCGYGSVKRARNGAFAIQTLVDRATQQPNRLFFEAVPELQDGLYRPEGSDQLHLVQIEKSLTHLPSVAALTAPEEQAFQERVRSLKLEKLQESGSCMPNGANFDCKDKNGRWRSVPNAYVHDFIAFQEYDEFDLDLEVKTADGDTLAVRDITAKTEIYSPFRDDRHPSAFVARTEHGVPYVFDSKLDRTYWPRSALLLQRVSMNESVALSQRFIGTALTYKDGATFLRSGMATGKTTALSSYLAALPTKDEPVLYICHRRSLAMQVASDHQLANYTDTLSLDRRVHRGLAICVDSVHKLQRQGKMFRHVIIDESEQLVRHLTGDTLGSKDGRRSQRFNVLEYLRQLLTQAKSVLAIDAHLSDLTKSFVCRDLSPTTHKREIVNDYQRYAGERVELFDSGPALVKDFHDQVGKDNKSALACDSKKQALSVFRELADAYPDKRGIVITADGVEAVGRQASSILSHKNAADALAEVLGDLNRVLADFDYFIYSPTVGTGYSIDKVVFDIVYGHFTHLIPSDNVQQLARIRTTGLRKAYYGQRSRGLKADRIPYLVEAEWRDSLTVADLLEEEGVRFNYCDGTPDISGRDYDYVQLHATVKYYEHRERVEGINRFMHLLQEQGFDLDVAVATDAEIKNGRALIKAGEQLRDEDYRVGVLNAVKITEDKARRLRLRSCPSKREYLELERFDLETFYGEPVSEDLIEFDDDGKMRKALPNFESLFENEDGLLIDDLRRISQDALLHSESQVVKAILFKELCVFLDGYTDLRSLDQTVICNSLLKATGFVQTCTDYKSVLDATFSCRVPKNIDEQPTSYLRMILNEFGIRASTAQPRLRNLPDEVRQKIESSLRSWSDDPKVRILRIDAGHYQRMLQYAFGRKPALMTLMSDTAVQAV